MHYWICTVFLVSLLTQYALAQTSTTRITTTPAPELVECTLNTLSGNAQAVYNSILYGLSIPLGISLVINLVLGIYICSKENLYQRIKQWSWYNKMESDCDMEQLVPTRKMIVASIQR